MLQTIESKLREVADLVFYGSADDVANNALWNYIVFFRDRSTCTANNTAYTDHYIVAIVHENWVPNEMIDNVISKMQSIPGIRIASPEIDFDYSRKPSTNAVIEIATLDFCHVRKRV